MVPLRRRVAAAPMLGRTVRQLMVANSVSVLLRIARRAAPCSTVARGVGLAGMVVFDGLG